jgi:hypothetical protein
MEQKIKKTKTTASRNSAMENRNHSKNGASPKSQMSRRNFLLFGIALFVFFAFVNKTMAQTWNISDNSSSGNNVTATLTVANNTLTISGNGNMADFDVSATGIPWNNYLTQIKTVVINSGVTNIGNIAFQGCNNLQTITIPSTVTIIGRQAFKNCTNPQLQITVPKEVATIEGEAFRNCYGTLTIESGDNTLNFSSGNYTIGYLSDWFKDSHIQTLYIGRNYTYAGTTPPFNGMFYLQALTIGNKISTIGSSAFANCTNLATVTLEDGPSDLSFDSNTFSQSPVKTVHLGRNLTMPFDGYYTQFVPFSGKTSLTTLTIGNEVKSIGQNAFAGCSGLNTPVIISNSVTSIGKTQH